MLIGWGVEGCCCCCLTCLGGVGDIFCGGGVFIRRFTAYINNVIIDKHVFESFLTVIMLKVI